MLGYLIMGFYIWCSFGIMFCYFGRLDKVQRTLLRDYPDNWFAKVFRFLWFARQLHLWMLKPFPVAPVYITVMPLVTAAMSGDWSLVGSWWYYAVLIAVWSYWWFCKDNDDDDDDFWKRKLRDTGEAVKRVGAKLIVHTPPPTPA